MSVLRHVQRHAGKKPAGSAEAGELQLPGEVLDTLEVFVLNFQVSPSCSPGEVENV
jgi:hypothetical protein